MVAVKRIFNDFLAVAKQGVASDEQPQSPQQPQAQLQAQQQQQQYRHVEMMDVDDATSLSNNKPTSNVIATIAAASSSEAAPILHVADGIGDATITAFLAASSGGAGQQLDSTHLAITNADFLAALRKVQPSSQREGFATQTDVTVSVLFCALLCAVCFMSVCMKGRLVYEDIYFQTLIFVLVGRCGSFRRCERRVE